MNRKFVFYFVFLYPLAYYLQHFTTKCEISEWHVFGWLRYVRNVHEVRR